jgi:hypothetical protein
MIFICLGVAAAAVCAFMTFGERLLFRWYSWELRRSVVADAPSEAVISYPLA